MTDSGDIDDRHVPDIHIRISVEEVEDGKDVGRISRLKFLTRVWLALYLLSVFLFHIGLRLGAYSFCAVCAVVYVVSFLFYTKYAFFVPDILRDGHADGYSFEYRRRMNVTWWKLFFTASLVSMVVFVLLRIESVAVLSMLAAVISFFVLVASIFRCR